MVGSAFDPIMDASVCVYCTVLGTHELEDNAADFQAFPVQGCVLREYLAVDFVDLVLSHLLPI